jgi:hypothetical protein
MTDRERLERECRVFTRLLVGQAPTEYVVSKYVEAHRAATAYTPRDRSDRWLVAGARRSPVAARLADAHARIFAPRSALRCKLVLLFAILETSPMHRRLEPNRPRAWALVFLGLAMSGAVGALAVAAGTAVFGPVRLVARALGREP